jgi:hypothetical protein
MAGSGQLGGDFTQRPRDWLSGSFPLKHYILNEDYVVIGDIGKGDRVAGISG